MKYVTHLGPNISAGFQIYVKMGGFMNARDNYSADWTGPGPLTPRQDRAINPIRRSRAFYAVSFVFFHERQILPSCYATLT